MDPQEQTVQPTLEEHIDSVKKEWASRIKGMNDCFVDLSKLRELSGTLYTQRQIAIEYHNTILNKIATMHSMYTKEYAMRYNFYRTQSTIMYKSDSAINVQIENDLKDMKYKLDMLDNFSKYLQETIRTIDDMIYGIPNRVRIEEILLGIDSSKRI